MTNRTTEELNDILDYKFRFDDADADSIREYFYALLFTLYQEGEGFSGKRPFGNSGWESDIFEAFVDMDAIEGKIVRDEDGYLQDFVCNYEEAWELTSKLLEHVFFGNND